jgi:thiamine-phosphate pyrophosphorylase
VNLRLRPNARELQLSAEPVSSPAPDPRPPSKARLRGLYAVTPDSDDDDWLASAVAAAIDGGARAIQYRNKGADPASRHRQALRLAKLCDARRIPLIVNDSIEIALAVGAAGVHLGRDDPDAELARARLGPAAIIGVSCYDEFELAERSAGVADHVAFGSLFASSVKPGALFAPLELLSRARARGWNVVGIGGIDESNVGRAVTAGADAVAVITAVFGSPGGGLSGRGLSGRPPAQVEAAARAMVAAIEEARIARDSGGA